MRKNESGTKRHMYSLLETATRMHVSLLFSGYHCLRVAVLASLGPEITSGETNREKSRHTSIHGKNKTVKSTDAVIISFFQ